MLCCRKDHIIAMDAMDEKWCEKVFIEEIEVAVEGWKCPTCGGESRTIWAGGRRAYYGPLRISGEKEILCRVRLAAIPAAL